MEERVYQKMWDTLKKEVQFNIVELEQMEVLSSFGLLENVLKWKWNCFHYQRELFECCFFFW